MFYQGTDRRSKKIGAPCKKKAVREFVTLKPRQYHNEGFDPKSLPSCSVPYDKSKDPLFAKKTRYEGEMAQREAVAQTEIERKKTMVAPLYNKAGYEYIGGVTDPTILKNLGRKV